jgi:hypothetical protein
MNCNANSETYINETHRTNVNSLTNTTLQVVYGIWYAMRHCTFYNRNN